MDGGKRRKMSVGKGSTSPLKIGAALAGAAHRLGSTEWAPGTRLGTRRCRAELTDPSPPHLPACTGHDHAQSIGIVSPSRRFRSLKFRCADASCPAA
jgi:hypothetical protein